MLQKATLSKDDNYYLKSIRTEEMYKLFWQKIIMQANELDIAEPTSPSKRKAPRRYEVGFGTGVTPYSTEDHFRANYYEALDTVIGFKQEGSCAIVGLKHVFMKRIAENDLSLIAFVSGITSNNFTSLTT